MVIMNNESGKYAANIVQDALGAPAGLPHNPMRILRVDRPVFHFSVVTTHVYDGSGTYK